MPKSSTPYQPSAERHQRKPDGNGRQPTRRRPEPPPGGPSEAWLFAEFWQAPALTPELARHILKLNWPETHAERMHELAVKNQGGDITAAEQRELDNYVRVGDLLGILQLRAHQVLGLPIPGITPHEPRTR